MKKIKILLIIVGLFIFCNCENPLAPKCDVVKGIEGYAEQAEKEEEEKKKAEAEEAEDDGPIDAGKPPAPPVIE